MTGVQRVIQGVRPVIAGAPAVALIALLATLHLTPSYAQTLSACESSGADRSGKIAATELTHTYPSGAVWSVCAALHPIVGLYLQDLRYQAPGDSLRRTFSELHLAGILEHYHDEPTERSVFETLSFGSDDFVSFTPATCPGQLSVLTALADSADNGEAGNNGETERNICTVFYADKILAKFDNATVTQNHSWDLIAAASHGQDTWEVVVTLGEEGTISGSINRSGVLHQFTDDPQFGRNLVNSALAVNSTIKSTWRIVPGMSAINTDATNATQTVEQLDFRLAPEFGNRRPMTVEPLTVETLRQVNREQFRRWQVKGDDGAGYLVDVQNNGFDFRSTQYNWALFDVAFTRYNECEITTLNNAENVANLTNGFSSPPCADSLQGFVNGESLEDTTPVIWFSQTTTITPDADDWPLLRTRVLTFDLVPFDWTQSSPFAPTPGAGANSGSGS